MRARDGRRAGDWKALAERGGGLLGAHGSHQVDLLRWWFGPVVAAFARLEKMTPDRIDPDTGAAWIATADDFVHLLTGHDRCRHADVRLSAVAPVAHENTTVVHGREGTLLLRHDDETLHVARDGGAFEEVTERDPTTDLPGVGPGAWTVATIGLLRELCDAIREGRAPATGATFEDGWRNQHVLDAARQANAGRR